MARLVERLRALRWVGAALTVMLFVSPVLAQTTPFVYRLPVQLRFPDGRPANDEVVQVWQKQGEANGPQTDTQVAACTTGVTGQCVLEYQLADFGDLPDLRIVGHTPSKRIVGVGAVVDRWVLEGEEVLAGINGTPLALVLDVDAAGGFTRDLNPNGPQPVPVWDLMVPPAQTEASAALATAGAAPVTATRTLQAPTVAATVTPTTTAPPRSPVPASPLPPTALPTAVASGSSAGSSFPVGGLLSVGLLAVLAIVTFAIRRRLRAQQGNRP